MRTETPEKSGKIFIISSPSCGGKTTVIRELLKKIPGSVQFLTTTTRKPRSKEKNGIDYHFISRKKFEQKIKKNHFIEHVEYVENLYGTDKKELEKALKKFACVFVSVDIRGKKSFDALHIPHYSIFLLPESLKILKKRILERGEDDTEYAKKRIEQAKDEIRASKAYDIRIINKQGFLEKTVQRLAEYVKRAT